MATHPVFDRLRCDQDNGPVVVAHRGDSQNHPENTLVAFGAARRLGVKMQEFDVRSTRDGVLVCMHDESFDRTTDAARKLGPGALVAMTSWTEAQSLDAGSWRGPGDAGERVPTLASALGEMLPNCIPMIEHKAGNAADYLDLLRTEGALEHVILQSFDWRVLAEAHRAAANLAIAVLGPTPDHPEPDREAISAALAIGAGMMHWQDRCLGIADVARIHAAGLLVCTYTTDDELGWAGGARVGFDAMCTNRPGPMLAVRAAGSLRRRRSD